MHHDEDLTRPAATPVSMAKWKRPALETGLIRVFLVDDHELIRRGVRDFLDGETDTEVVGEAGTRHTPFRETARQAIGR